MDIREKLKLLLNIKKLPDGKDLEGFTDEQLEEARLKAGEVFKAAREEKDAETAEEALEIARTVKAELTERTDAAEKLEAKFAEMEAEFAEPEVEASTDGQDGAGDGNDGGDGGNGDDNDASASNDDGDDKEGEDKQVPNPAAAAPVTPEAVAADAEPKDEKADALRARLLAAAAKPIVPKSSAPPADNGDSPVRIVASADVSDFSPGMKMDIDDMGRAFVEKAKATSGGRPGTKSKVAKLYLSDIPEDRVFNRSDPAEHNMARINELVAGAQEDARQRLRQMTASRDPEEITELAAAGGFCRPFPVRYDICTQGDDHRPLRDSLISLRLDRGGLQYIKPPFLSEVDGSVNVYTEDQDTTGYDYPKGCIRVECPDSDEAIVQAITLCMEVGNFQRLAWPEVFNTWWSYGKVLHARTAEEELWNRMVSLSTARTANTNFGAFRNTITELERYVHQMRYEYRINGNVPLRLWIPEWMVAQLRADLTFQQPGDSTLAVSDATLYQYLANLGITVTTVADGQDPGTGDDPLPTSAVGILAFEGTFIFGELGELDFGTQIQDWDQIRNNDSGAFLETFETVFDVCNGPQAITFNLCPTGQSAAAETDLVDCYA